MLSIILAILIFSLIVIIHELGHFLLAKKNGICVEEFAIGIGPTLFGIRKGETKYSIKCLPFGGCCVMLGEDGENNDPRAFGNKSALARFSVIFAGPFFNFILAFVLALFVVGFGGADPAVVGNVEPGSAAYEAGLQEGDRIVRLDGSRIYNFREISLYNFMHTDTPEVDVTYERDGVRNTVTVKRHEKNGSYLLGVTMTDDTDVGLLGTLKYSLLEVRYQIKSTFFKSEVSGERQSVRKRYVRAGGYRQYDRGYLRTVYCLRHRHSGSEPYKLCDSVKRQSGRYEPAADTGSGRRAAVVHYR